MIAAISRSNSGQDLVDSLTSYEREASNGADTLIAVTMDGVARELAQLLAVADQENELERLWDILPQTQRGLVEAFLTDHKLLMSAFPEVEEYYAHLRTISAGQHRGGRSKVPRRRTP